MKTHAVAAQLPITTLCCDFKIIVILWAPYFRAFWLAPSHVSCWNVLELPRVRLMASSLDVRRN
jgi:hypothetical protein